MSGVNRKDLVEGYCKGVSNATNEQAKKERFITLLTNLFGDHDEFGIIDQFAGGAEKALTKINRADKKTDRGRADTQYGSVIIEFEHDLNKTGAHAEEQLQDYLSGNWNDGVQINFTLIATDCLIWKVYTPDYDSLIKLGELNAEDIHLTCINTFEVTADRANDFYYFLDRFLFRSEPLPASLEEIRNEFGYGSDIFQTAMLLLHRHYATIKDTPEMLTAYGQWHKFLSIAYGRFNASEQAFLTQSYLSILAKMLAYEVLTGDDFIDEDETHDILSGEAFKRKGVANFTDEDFFRWTAQENNFRALSPVFRAIAHGFSRFNFVSVTEDILKGVYQELVDEDTRHALGEHYTPDWLCAYVVSELNPRPGQRVLDPSCGSGSFLKAVANHLIAVKPEISAAELNSLLFGIDVHPLSVQITKATLLIALGRRVRNEPQPITLNVFLANTLLLPRKEVSLLGSRYKISIDNKVVEIDESLFADRSRFYEIIFHCDYLAEADVKVGKTRERQQISPTFIVRYGIRTEAFLDSVYALYKALSQAKQSGRDSIWAYIISNSYSPFFLQEAFDLVVGNPPWLTFKDIDNGDYQKEIERIAEQYNLRPERQNLRTQLEIAALFLGHCVNYFMKPEGRLAFVMPRSFFSAGQHANTRQGRAKRVKITEAWDLREVTPLFKVPSCVLFARRGQDGAIAPRQFPGKRISGRLSKNNAGTEEAREKLTVNQDQTYLARMGSVTAWSMGKNIQLGGANPYRTLFQNGATIFPRRLFFIDITQDHEGPLLERRLRVRSSDAVLREAKKPWKDVTLTGTVHTRFMFQTALANNVVPFSLNGLHTTALPAVIPNGQLRLLTPEQIMRETGEIESSEWFTQVEQIWEKKKTERNQNTSIQDYLNWMHKLEDQQFGCNYVVIYTAAGSNTVSTVVNRAVDSFFPFIVDHITYMYFTNNEQEAHYLCAFFNSRIPNQLIKPFQSQGLMGARHIHTKILEIPLPRFDADNPLHTELATLSAQAAASASAFVLDQNLGPHGGNMTSSQTGRFRNTIREHLFAEMDAIDIALAQILGV
ncbi:MAG: N-6 DNA methylase [Desulfovibrio sp.]